MPTETEQRDLRQRVLRSLLGRAEGRGQGVRSQAELVELLDREGIAATQSSVSRDLRELGAAKVGGRYVLPAPPGQAAPRQLAEAAAFVRAIRRAGPHLTVVGTAVGAAQAVAVALDRAAWPEVAGTLAGDDTLFIATAGGRQQGAVIRRLEAVMRGEDGR